MSPSDKNNPRPPSTSSELLLAYYGDDFTGSTDALEFLSRAGARTRLFLDPPTPAQLARHPSLQAIGVAGLTRSLAPADMERTLRPAFTALRALGSPHVHYKVCSTFDSSPTTGSIGRAIDVGSEIFQRPFVPLLIGAPALGRHCVFGTLFARMGIGSTGEIHRLDRHPSASKHPITPMHEADLRLHLAQQTKKKTGLFNILQLELPDHEAHAALAKLIADKNDIVLFDLLYASQLPRIGSLLDEHASRLDPLFTVGSSGVEMALGAHWDAKKRLSHIASWPHPGAVEPLLVVCGSCSPVTARQLAWARENKFTEIRLDTHAATSLHHSSALAATIEAAVQSLARGHHTVVHTGGTAQVDPHIAALGARSAEILGTALGNVVRGTLERLRLKRVLFAGGDSSSYAARAVGIEAVEMIAPLAPGAPLCRAYAPNSPADNLEVNFKGGQVGADDYFAAVASGHL
ncbi:serine kinase [Nibricoccus aquaticus]|uniref:Serine kinase n=1 Tax=Nibricoccus aquaticus TaxID=2576891 RepID=A0A290QDE7_9BACT|nr:serine kinase [Nibricoccus aquaticus]